MANEHPFQMLFETLGRVPIAHAESVNRQAYEILYDILSVPEEKPGRCILLRAPRAGHGKTHLLSRIQHHLGASHEFIPLHAAFGCQIDASTVIDDAMRRLLRPLPASGGLCVLDLVARRLFSTALQPLVASGEVPCQDREGALTALRTRPIETFDFNHPNAITAHWARENFEILGQRLSVELAQRCDLPVREISFWVDCLFRFAATPAENSSRLRSLDEAVHAGNPAEGVLMERLEALLGMLALLMRVVLVADDLEGFSTDETAALRLAAFLGNLRQAVERLDVILSLNQDIWESAFMPRLSGGLADRLSEVVVELNPLSEDEMVALLESRVPGLGSRVLARMDRGSAGTHARGLIRAAGMAWLKATAMDSQPPKPAASPVSELTAPAFEPVSSAIILQESQPTVPETPVMVETVTESAPPPTLPESPFQAEISVAKEAEPPPVVVERAPDPTLAIAFLAAGSASAEAPEAWPAPDFSTPEPVNAPEPVAAPAMMAWESPFEPALNMEETPAAVPFISQPQTQQPSVYGSAPAALFEPSPEPAPVFQPAPEPVATPVFQAAPEPEPQSTPEPMFAPVFQPAPEPPPTPVFHAAPEPPPTPVFQAAPEPPVQPVIEPVEAPAKPSVPDTDRVDDLLRQFRERYGRGAM